jgi:hypothetical protein
MTSADHTSRCSAVPLWQYSMGPPEKQKRCSTHSYSEHITQDSRTVEWHEGLKALCQTNLLQIGPAPSGTRLGQVGVHVGQYPISFESVGKDV